MPDREDRPTSPEEVVEKHGRETIGDLAADGNITAQVVLDMVDETDGEYDG